MNKPALSKQAFWDVDMDKIDYEKDLLFVIEQVVDWSTLDDFICLLNFFGKSRIRQEILNTKVLGDREINFCCIVLDIKISDFKHYIQRPSRSYPQFLEAYRNYSNC